MSFSIRNLIEQIDSRKVIPIIGTDVIKINDGHAKVPLLDVLLDRLLKKYADEGETFSFGDNCITANDKLNHIHAVAIKKYLSFYGHVAEILEEIEPSADTSSLDKLARIKKFRFYMNASYSSLLGASVKKHRALTSEYYKSISLDIYDSPFNDVDIPQNGNIYQSLRKPIVYNLFNQYDATIAQPHVIVADDDILELLHTLNQSKDKLPTLFELMYSSSLLFIGCSFPDWLLRFFIRMFSPGKLSGGSNGKLRTVADVLQDKNRALFISNSDLKYFELDGNAFIDHLFDEINKNKSTQSWIRNSNENSYSFISYSTEDREAASRIFEQLDDLNCDTYMDVNRLEYGDEITPDIEKAILNCKIFIPVVSKATHNAINKKRYHKSEWKYAIDLYNDKKADFIIIPLFIDAITDNDNEFETTPKIFFSLKHEKLPTNQKFSVDLREKIKVLIK